MLGNPELKAMVEKEYSLDVKNINLVAKDTYRVEADQGYFRLSRVMVKPKKLLFAHSISQGLLERGEQIIPLFFLNQAGLPYCELGGRYWILNEWVNGRNPELHQLKEVEQVTRSLARLHRWLYGIRLFEGSKGKKDWEKWQREMQRGKKIYDTYLKSLDEKKVLTDFDQMILKKSQEMNERLNRVSQLALSKSCQQLIKDEKEFRSIAYHMMKEKDMLLGLDGQIHFMQPFHMCYDLRVKDLGQWLKRLVKKGAILEEMVPKVISWYEAERPLSRGEKDWLLAYLLYPTKLLKMIERYYLKQKNWPEVGYVRKLRKALQVADRELLAYREMLLLFDELEE